MSFPTSLRSFSPPSPLPSFLPLFLGFSQFFPGNIPVSCIKPLLKNRKILNWTMKGSRHKAILQWFWRKEEINRVKFLFTCWPATRLPPSVMFFFLLSWRSFYCWYLVISSVTIIDISAWDYHITSTCGSCVTIKALLIKYQKEYTESYWSFRCPLPCPFLQIRVWLFYLEIQR